MASGSLLGCFAVAKIFGTPVGDPATDAALQQHLSAASGDAAPRVAAVAMAGAAAVGTGRKYANTISGDGGEDARKRDDDRDDDGDDSADDSDDAYRFSYSYGQVYSAVASLVNSNLSPSVACPVSSALCSLASCTLNEDKLTASCGCQKMPADTGNPAVISLTEAAVLAGSSAYAELLFEARAARRCR